MAILEETATPETWTYVVEFVVEAAGVADGLSVVVAPPQRRHRRLAVGAGRPGSPRCRLQIR